MWRRFFLGSIAAVDITRTAYYTRGLELMKLIFAVLDLSLTMCFITHRYNRSFFTFIVIMSSIDFSRCASVYELVMDVYRVRQSDWWVDRLIKRRCYRSAVQARRIAIHPKSYSRPALRIELYGCQVSNDTATFTNVTRDIEVSLYYFSATGYIRPLIIVHIY